MRIGIWHWSTRLFDGERLRRLPFGGTETAVGYTAEALARSGAQVTVFCNTDSESVVAGVRYVPADPFRGALGETDFDAFLFVRHLSALTVPVRSRCVAYWSHDNCQQPFLHGMFRSLRAGKHCAWGDLGQLMGPIDLVLCVSKWQRDAIVETFGIEQGRTCVVGNGLQPDIFDNGAPLPAKRPIMVYSLPPDRGLLSLIQVFAEVKLRVPQAELHAFSSLTIYGSSAEQDEELFGELFDLVRSVPGARLYAPIGQRGLAAAMARSRVYAYPTKTRETFCISLLEAQASGAVPVSSPLGAIPERIEHGVDGFLVPGDPAGESYINEFVERSVQLLQDDELQRHMAAKGRERALSETYSYDTVAARLLEALETFVRSQPIRSRVLDIEELCLFDRQHPDQVLPDHQRAELQHSYEDLLHLV